MPTSGGHPTGATTTYERLIGECLEAGIRIDGLGLQSHMHQGYWGEEKTHDVLDRFSRFGLPLHFTETTLLSGDLMPPEIVDLNDYKVAGWPSTDEGEARQAEELTRHYETLVRHPAVETINYWGISDEGAWLGAPSGLVRADGTPKPAFTALRDLSRVSGGSHRPRSSPTRTAGSASRASRGPTASTALDCRRRSS